MEVNHLSWRVITGFALRLQAKVTTTKCEMWVPIRKISLSLGPLSKLTSINNSEGGELLREGEWTYCRRRRRRRRLVYIHILLKSHVSCTYVCIWWRRGCSSLNCGWNFLVSCGEKTKRELLQYFSIFYPTMMINGLVSCKNRFTQSSWFIVENTKYLWSQI